jgi:hypothetical protein
MQQQYLWSDILDLSPAKNTKEKNLHSMKTSVLEGVKEIANNKANEYWYSTFSYIL